MREDALERFSLDKGALKSLRKGHRDVLRTEVKAAVERMTEFMKRFDDLLVTLDEIERHRKRRKGDRVTLGR